MPMAMYTGKRTLQPRPKVGMAAVAPHMAIYGAMKEAMAFTNCPKVMVLASRSPLMMLVMSGFREVCMSALPMPSSEKETSMSP